MQPLKLLLPTVYDPREWSQPYSAASMFLGASVHADPLLRERFDIRLVSFDSASDPAIVAEALAAHGPDILGVGLYAWNEAVLRRALPIVKRLRPGLRILMGGQTVLYSDAAFHRDYPDVELFFRGDSEEVFAEVLRRLVNGGYDRLVSGEEVLDGLSGHANFAVRAHSRASSDLRRIASYYLPDSSGRGLFDLLAAGHWESLWWETSRGCVYTCAFCGFDAQELGFRHHPVERVLAEFDLFIARGVRRIMVTDAILGGKMANAKAVLRGLSQPERAHDIYLYGFVRPEMIDEELASLLKSARFGFVNVGLQTVNPAVPREMRSNKLDAIRRGLPWLAVYGVPFQLDLIAGFPGDTFEGFCGSLRFVIEDARPSRFRVYRLGVLAGTPLDRMVRTHGAEWLSCDGDGLATGSYSWVLDDLLRMLRLANLAVALYAYLRRKDWLGREDELRNLDHFLALFEWAEANPDVAGDLTDWDQKSASLDEAPELDAVIEALLERVQPPIRRVARTANARA